jgi:tRNA(His) 5'-end guanylyltransferase
MLVKNFLRLNEYWSLIEQGISTVAAGAKLRGHKKVIERCQTKGLEGSEF